MIIYEAEKCILTHICLSKKINVIRYKKITFCFWVFYFPQTSIALLIKQIHMKIFKKEKKLKEKK